MIRKPAAFMLSAALVIGIYLAARWRAQRPPAPPPPAAVHPSAFDVQLPEFRYQGKLAGALQELSRKGRVRFEVDWESLAKDPPFLAAQVQLNLRQVTVGQVLRVIMRQVFWKSPVCELRPNGAIFIGKPRSHEEPQVEPPIVRIYDVSSMVTAGRRFWETLDGGRIESYLDFKRGRSLRWPRAEADLPLVIMVSTECGGADERTSTSTEVHLIGNQLVVKACPDLQSQIERAVSAWRLLLTMEAPCTNP